MSSANSRIPAPATPYGQIRKAQETRFGPGAPPLLLRPRLNIEMQTLLEEKNWHIARLEFDAKQHEQQDKEYEELRIKYNELKDNFEIKQTEANEWKDKHAIAENLHTQEIKARKALESKADEAEKLKAESREKNRRPVGLEGKISVLEQDNAQLLHAASEFCVPESDGSVASKIAELTAELDNLRLERTWLESRVNNLQDEDYIKGLELEVLEETKTELLMVKEDHDELGTMYAKAVKELIPVRNKVQALESENEKLKASKFGDSAGIVQDLERKVRNLEVQLENNRNEFESSKVQLAHFQSLVKKLEQENDELQSRYQSKTSALTMSTAGVQTEPVEVRRLDSRSIDTTSCIIQMASTSSEAVPVESAKSSVTMTDMCTQTELLLTPIQAKTEDKAAQTSNLLQDINLIINITPVDRKNWGLLQRAKAALTRDSQLDIKGDPRLVDEFKHDMEARARHEIASTKHVAALEKRIKQLDKPTVCRVFAHREMADSLAAMQAQNGMQRAQIDILEGELRKRDSCVAATA